MTLKEALIKGAEALRTYSETPRLDADVLMSSLLGLTKIKLFSEWHRVLSPQEERNFFALIERRRRHEPVAYIVGKKEFFGRDFKVNEHVLVPRPETELLVEKALEISEEKASPRILDLGTGSGCIIESLVLSLNEKGIKASAVAVDVSGKALEVAKENALQHGCIEQIKFLQGSWFAPVEGVFDLILSNPPYIAAGDTNISKELRYEPQQALFSGATGYECILEIVATLPKFLAPGGIFLCETGAGQHNELRRVLLEAGWPATAIEFFKDLAGNERLLSLR